MQMSIILTTSVPEGHRMFCIKIAIIRTLGALNKGILYDECLSCS